ncbi:unnamed protein product [Rotaria sp. Silwood1]|nr:unnamed protein product [Rotaria sp. Silwood1]CAF0934586.1 unnamed protein product [Rotaria sp. Silwood1]CAF1023792.1 unnamed protein product [Rotaria sp. Silwood1]CAF3366240.1 unnamed protein product [Rotaria sp. Silwood1]CAF3402559.1 unnamed protein product [Rotaria sp. Silwood1]
MAFSNLFRRYSTSNDIQAPSYAYMDGNSIAETLLEELENQCRNSLALGSLQNKRDSDIVSSSITGSFLSTHNSSLNVIPTKRHSSVDYSWLTPSTNLLQSTNELYHLPDIIKMELSELILNVLPEDCTLIINQFRRHIRAQTKPSTSENIIALFRKTISDYIDQKQKNRTNTNNINDTINSNIKSNNKCSTNIYSLVRNNRINPKRQFDDEQHCIAELTEISITSSSNDGTENNHPHSLSHA